MSGQSGNLTLNNSIHPLFYQQTVDSGLLFCSCYIFLVSKMSRRKRGEERVEKKGEKVFIELIFWLFIWHYSYWHRLLINSSANFNLQKNQKFLSPFVRPSKINLCQYILVHWKRNAMVIYNMNIIKNVLVRVVHMLQDINTLMHIRARLSTESTICAYV